MLDLLWSGSGSLILCFQWAEILWTWWRRAFHPWDNTTKGAVPSASWEVRYHQPILAWLWSRYKQKWAAWGGLPGHIFATIKIAAFRLLPPLTSLLPTFKHLLYSSLDKPRCVLKCRDINLPIKVCIVKAIVFPVVMYGCESWTINKAEHWRIDAFELWCWWKLLRVNWTAKRSKQSFLKEISPEYSLEGLMLKLRL